MKTAEKSDFGDLVNRDRNELKINLSNEDIEKKSLYGCGKN